ncbi:hypothetical protein WB91_20850, partial [bacteria symbiont BFo1 of Frankliniella occidentalis]
GIEKGIEQGIQLGEKRGFAKGLNQARIELARSMLQNGIDRSTVIKITGLSEAEMAHICH